MRKTALVMLSAIFTVGVGCRTETDPKTVEVGFPVALSGANARVGAEIKRGVDIALAEVKESGVAGKSIVIRSNDTDSQPDRAEAMARRMVAQHKVAAMLEGDPGQSALQVADICQNWQPAIPMILSTSGHSRLTEQRRTTLRVCLSDEARARVLAGFAATEGIKSVVILRPEVEEKARAMSSADAFAEAFARTFQSKGAVKRNEVFPTKAEARTALVTQLKSEKDRPDAVVLAGTVAEVARMRSALSQEGLEGVRVLAGCGPEAELYLADHGAALQGVYACAEFVAGTPNPEAAATSFENQYREQHKRPPSTVAALGYDSARLLFEAMRQANSTEPPRIREQLGRLGQFRSVTGLAVMCDDRNLKRPAWIVRVETGKLVPVKKLAANEL